MAGEAGEAFVIGQAVVQELGGNGPLGEVEEMLSARAAGGGEFPDQTMNSTAVSAAGFRSRRSRSRASPERRQPAGT